MKGDKRNNVRYIRCGYIVGWEPQVGGLLLMYSDGSRELIPMSEQEADENSEFLVENLFDERDCLGIEWESLDG